MAERPPRGESYRLRVARCSLPGLTYHVTFRMRTADALCSDEARQVMIESLHHAAGDNWCEFFGFVVMPDHVHLVLRLGETKGLGDLVASLKKWTARRINDLAKGNGNLWQDGFHEHAVRTDEDLRRILEYVAWNPVKAGLARELGEYPWCWVPGLYAGEAFATTERRSGSGEPSHGL